MKKITILTALLLTAGLSACKKNDGDYKYGSLNVSFPTGVIRTANDIVAESLGYFKEEGVKVNQVNISGPTALAALNENLNNLDILTVGFVPDVQAISKGYDNLVFIGGTAVEGGAIIAKKGNANNYKSSETIIDYSKIKTATLGLQRNEAAWVVTREYLKNNNADFDDSIDNNLKYYQDAQTVAQAVSSGDSELGFLPLEYAKLYADSFDIELVTAAGDLMNEYVCCRQVTSREKYQEKYDAFVAYEKAKIRAWEYMEKEENIDNVVKIISDYSHKEPDYIKSYIYGGIFKQSIDPNTSGIINYTAALNNAKVITSTINVADYVDTNAYKKALDSLISENPSNSFYKEKLDLFNEYN